MEMTPCQRLGSGTQSRLIVNSASDVGACRRAAQRLAENGGFDATACGRVAIVASELANNLLRHGRDGEFLLDRMPMDGTVHLQMLAIDRGPGMTDVDLCMRDGYSTAGTSGNGLGAVRRQSTVFDAYSQPGVGTVVLSQIAAHTSKANDGVLEVGAVNVPLNGEVDCGDAWRVAWDRRYVAAFVVDGLGHGPAAARVAHAAAESFDHAPFSRPREVIERCHTALDDTRGAAAACLRLELASSDIVYSGVGNICSRIVSPQQSSGMVSHSGILGAHLPRIQEFEYRLAMEGCLVMHSDGVISRWSFGDFPGLATHRPAVIAGMLYLARARGRDDTTIVVVRRRS
jgi:anti-sigma regulatory factor (Ser/Thr protein kinase)